MLRPATDADIDAVLAWRNHPDVRTASLQQHVITEPEHRSWWARTMSDTSRRVLIYEREGHPSGVVTFFDHDLDARSACWGYYLDVEGLDERGQTLLAWFEVQRQAVQYAFDDLGLDVLEGEQREEHRVTRAGGQGGDDLVAVARPRRRGVLVEVAGCA